MPHRLRILLILILLLPAACSSPPAGENVLPSSVPSIPTSQPPAPSPQPLSPSPQPSSPTSQPPTPTPTGPLAQIAAWGEGLPLAAAYTPDGQAIVVLRPGSLELRPASDLADLRWRIIVDFSPAGLAVTPDSRTIAVAAGATVELYAVADGAAIGTIPGLGAPIAAIAISPDGRLLAAAQADQVIALWDIAERSLLSELRLPQPEEGFVAPGSFTSVAFSADGQQIVAGDDGGNVGVWALADGVALQSLSVGLRVVADVAFSPDGALVAAASEGWRSEAGSIWLWDAVSGAELHRLTIDSGERLLAPAQRLAFSPDGARLYMGLADGELLRWSLADLSRAEALRGHTAAITALAVAPDGAGLLSAARDGSLRTWHADGAPAETLVGVGAISALAISPDGALVISADAGGTIEIRRPDGALIGQIPGQGGPIADLAVSPDGATLAAAGGDGVVRLWGLPDGTPRGELAGHVGPVRAVAFAPDSSRLASAGLDGSLRLWRVAAAATERAAVVLETDGISSPALHQLAFSPDGQVIAVAGEEGAVSLWRSSDLTLIERRPVEGAGTLLQVAFGPDGALLACSFEGQMYRWDGPGAAGPILSPGLAGFALTSAGELATLAGETLQVWRGPGAALERHAEAPAPGYRLLAAGPGLIALGSRLGYVSTWSVR